MGKAALNAAEMKRANRRRVLEHVRGGGCSRIQLAGKTGLTRSAISVIVDELLREGILLEGQTMPGNVGRRGTELTLNPHAFYVLGLDISRSHFTVGLVDFCGNLIGEEVRRPLNGAAPAQVLGEIDRELERLRACAPEGMLLGLGITAPGPLDVKGGKLLNPPNFAGWQGVELVSHFAASQGCPVLLENNSGALALAEKAYGLGCETDTFLAVVVDTGIGGGFIRRGSLYKGSAGFGTELGHASINFSGPPCTCGNLGCAEVYASIPNIVKSAQLLNPALDSWQKIINMAKQSVPDAVKIVEQEVEYLCCALVGAVQLLDVPCIVFFGDICYEFEYIRKQIRQTINQRILSRTISQVEILPTRLAGRPKTLPSANLVIEQYIQTGESACQK